MFPYIGITDFTSPREVRAMASVFRKHVAPGSSRRLHVGVMMSYKTLWHYTTKWSSIFPSNKDIAGIFCSESVFNCLHYADYDVNTEVWKSLAWAMRFGGSGLHALQLDMIWPNPKDIAEAMSDSEKSIEIILQVGKNAIEMMDNDPNAVARKLGEYDGIINRVLLDKSMGRGLGMDARALIPFARAIKDKFPDIGLGAAGGLGPETMDLVMPLLEEFPDLSIDAQGKLRPSGNALDPVDWRMAGLYLIEALKRVQ